MTYCVKCGAQVEDGIGICPQCGAVIPGAFDTPDPQNPYEDQNTYSSQAYEGQNAYNGQTFEQSYTYDQGYGYEQNVTYDYDPDTGFDLFYDILKQNPSNVHIFLNRYANSPAVTLYIF